MPNENSKHSGDEMTPALRKALIESGALIPTTPNDVVLAQRLIDSRVSPEIIAAAFARLERLIDDAETNSTFIKIDGPMVSDGLQSMAARNGEELDAETLAKLDQAITEAIDKPPQSEA